MHAVHDSEEMAADIAGAADNMWGAEAGEMFSRGYDAHAFNVVTPAGREFLVTVQDVTQHHPRHGG